MAYFADPYAGEVLYSAYARLFERTRYDNPHTFMRAVFASRHLTSLVDLPNNLNYLAAILPPGHRYSPDRLIEEHTLFPLYRPFLLPDRLEQLRQAMLSCNSNSIHLRIGITGNGALVPMPQTLCFCPNCIIEDREDVGECFWHRIHQVPGVEVCPKHTVFLMYSQVPTQCAWQERCFATAEQATCATTARSLDLTNPNHIVLLNVARDVHWLLQECTTTPSPIGLRQQYLMMLGIQKMVARDQKQRAELLSTLVKQHFNEDLLSLFHCELKDRASKNWLTRLLFDPNYFSHPLHHLLLIQYLGYSVKDFFTLALGYQPFGQGPWPCLNLASSHYKQFTIHDCTVTHSRTRAGAVIGVFSCECGYVYSRVGPDQVADDYYRYSKVQAYGLVWETKLKELWMDKNLSLPTIARQLGVDRDTVQRHARHLRLPYPRS